MNRAFTLIELLVAIAVIGILSTLAIQGYSYAKERAKTVKTENDIASIYQIMGMLANDTNFWPGQQAINQVGSGGANEICSDGCAYGLEDARAGIIATDGNYPGWDGPYYAQDAAGPLG